MARTAPRPCTAPGCGKLVHDGSGRCEAHKLPAWGKRANVAKRITGRRLQAMRKELFEREPLCRACRLKPHPMFTVATQRDHIRSLEEGGTDTDDNVQPLCHDCHREKSLAEALRGRRGAGEKFGAVLPETGR